MEYTTYLIRFMIIDEDPWVITFDNFLTKEECQHLIDLGYKNGYERSTDFRGIGNDRTSENSWCYFRSGCRQDPIVQKVLDRMANVTGIPQEYYEDLQLLKVSPGRWRIFC